VAHSMIRARLTLTDGTTPGALRYGAANILACIARGCRIVPDPVNAIPEEWAQHMAGEQDEQTTVEAPQPRSKKRGRPKKVSLR
jgi:hypothetical protein